VTNSLINEPITLVSLGISCQSAHQLARLADANPTTFTFVKGPFDWLICPVKSAAEWLDSDLKSFNPNDIIEFREHAFWPKMDFWFWHGFMRKDDLKKTLDIEATSQRELKKLAYQCAIFRALDPKRTVFVCSNVQYNLETEVFPDDAAKPHHLTPEHAVRLQAALDSFFGSATRLVFVSQADRDPQKCAHIHLPTERSEWKGNNKYWDNLVAQTLLQAQGKV